MTVPAGFRSGHIRYPIFIGSDVPCSSGVTAKARGLLTSDNEVRRALADNTT